MIDLQKHNGFICCALHVYADAPAAEKKVTYWLAALFNTSNACTGNILGKISAVQI